jgi:hypothetical protein
MFFFLMLDAREMLCSELSTEIEYRGIDDTTVMKRLQVHLLQNTIARAIVHGTLSLGAEITHHCITPSQFVLMSLLVSARQ